jgi:hypothetical protein
MTKIGRKQRAKSGKQRAESGDRRDKNNESDKSLIFTLNHLQLTLITHTHDSRLTTHDSRILIFLYQTLLP